MKILIYHDERLFSESLACMLVSRGHQVPSCSSTITELLSDIRSDGAQVCLVEVKAASLVSAIQAIRRASAALPVVVLSADLRASSVASAIAGGASGVCLKIDSLAEIERVLRDVAGRHRSDDHMAPICSHAARSLVNRNATTARLSGSNSKSLDLTPKELAVLELLVQGATTTNVATVLAIGEATVRTHLQHLFSKFGVHSRLALVASAIRMQVLQDQKIDDVARLQDPGIAN